MTDGRFETQVRTPTGAWVRVHSAYAPEPEARAFLDKALDGQPVPPVVAVLGVGLGYVIDELARRRSDVRIVALELAPSFIEGWSKRRDWTELTRKGRLITGTDPGFDLPVPSPSWPAAALEPAPLVLVHPVIGQHQPEALARAHKAFQQFLFEQRANAEARQRLAALYLRHTIENLPTLAVAPDVSALDGIASGDPLVLIGAGPSLDRLLPELAKHRDRAWFVALDTALRPLMQAGIVPDIVVAVDPTTLNGRHLINLPSRARPWLVAEGSVDPRAINAFAGRVLASRLGNADPWPWLEGLGMSPTRLRVWGSVLTASCDLVLRMRASCVLFAGMDLAFTNAQSYCRGTAFEEDWEAQRVRDGLDSIEAVWEVRIREHAVEELDVNGRPTRTAPSMIAFRNWARTYVASAQGCSFFNVTGAGILHGGNITQADVATALGGARCNVNPLQVLERVVPESRATGPAQCALAIERMTAEPCDTGVMADWAEAVPGFDADVTRNLLLLAGRRLRRLNKDEAMIATETDWIDVPYDASNFGARAPLSWQVSSDGVVTYAYRVQNKTMTLVFMIERSRVELTAGGTNIPSNELHLRIPGNYLPARGAANAFWMGGVGGRECGYARVHPGHGHVILFRGAEDLYALDPGYFVVMGEITFEVQ